ncbi:MAG: hypothetical protein ACRDKG_10475 [Actinomycetota bacterium]
MRRPIPLRVKVAIAGMAGLGLAWLIPRGGGAPEPSPSPTPTVTATDRPGVTAVQVPLSLVPQGVSYHPAGELRVFLVRKGNAVVGFVGRSTAGAGPVWWCQKNVSFEDESGAVRYDIDGRALPATAPRDLDRVRVIVTGDRLTIFPDSVTGGATATPGSATVRLPEPCSAAERVG